MPNIGDKIHSRDLGFKGTLSWYTWADCVDCGKQSWVRAIAIKDRSWVCASCSNKKSRLHKNTIQILQSGVRECRKCHKMLPATKEYFGKAKSKIGIRGTCRGCANSYSLEKLHNLSRVWNICSICGRKELIYDTGKQKSICGGCSQKLSGKQKLPRPNRGENPYRPRTESQCYTCNKVFPATIRYFKRSKATKSGLYLRRCRQCLNRERLIKERATLLGRLNRKFSTYIYQSLRGEKAGNHWESLVGWNVKALIKHLQEQFKDGMSWNNYGEWHIDHIIPQSAFHYESPDDIDFKRCWALSNLQPLWGVDNVLKSNKILIPFQPSLKFENKNIKGALIKRVPTEKLKNPFPEKIVNKQAILV